MGSLGGGGRYDNLTGVFGWPMCRESGFLSERNESMMYWKRKIYFPLHQGRS
jgi:hypothetical protein